MDSAQIGLLILSTNAIFIRRGELENSWGTLLKMRVLMESRAGDCFHLSRPRPRRSVALQQSSAVVCRTAA